MVWSGSGVSPRIVFLADPKNECSLDFVDIEKVTCCHNTLIDVGSVCLHMLCYLMLINSTYGAVHLEPAYFVQPPNRLEVKNYM